MVYKVYEKRKIYESPVKTGLFLFVTQKLMEKIIILSLEICVKSLFMRFKNVKINRGD